MQYDRRGLAVTTESAAAIARFDEATRSFLAHRSDAGDHLNAALDHDPDLAIAHCMSGFALLLLGHGELFAPARAAAARARTALSARGGTAREAALLDALDDWIAGEMECCAATLEAHLAVQPLDALAFKLLHALHFILGDATGMRRVAEAVRAAWSADAPEFGFILGCHAFALEETGVLDLAERSGCEAMAIEAEDVWACHAVAHVYEMAGRPDTGLAWLRGRQTRLNGVNNFAAHLAWHEALYHLARGNHAAALALYDDKVRAARTDDYRDITNAGSLLWRLERAGCAVGGRWSELADLAEQRSDDRALVFAQLNYLLCLIGAGRSAAATMLLGRLRRWAEDGSGTQAERAAQIGVPLALVLSGKNDAAIALPFCLRYRLHGIGGSRAQRAIFAQILGRAAQSHDHGPLAAVPTRDAPSTRATNAHRHAKGDLLL